MKYDPQFAAEAGKGALMMVILPLVGCLVLFRLTTLPLTWQDWARGLGILIFIYLITMRRRYQQRRQG